MNEISTIDILTVDNTGQILLSHTGEHPLIIRDKILRLKDFLLSLPDEEKREFEVEHFCANGIYTRKLHIPKGSILIGKIHLTECVNIVAQGDISICTETGSARVKAGYTVVSPAGIMKVGYAHEDTIFINVFRTDETEIDKIEAEIACDSYEYLSIGNLEQGELSCQ